jgi:hypothetical protein
MALGRLSRLSSRRDEQKRAVGQGSIPPHHKAWIWQKQAVVGYGGGKGCDKSWSSCDRNSNLGYPGQFACSWEDHSVCQRWLRNGKRLADGATVGWSTRARISGLHTCSPLTLVSRRGSCGCELVHEGPYFQNTHCWALQRKGKFEIRSSRAAVDILRDSAAGVEERTLAASVQASMYHNRRESSTDFLVPRRVLLGGDWV